MAAKAGDLAQAPWDPALLSSQEEWELVKLLGSFPDAVELAGRTKDPSVVAGHTYDLAKAFSKFYHDHPVLTVDDKKVAAGRLRLSLAVGRVLQNAFELLNIPFLRSM